MWPRSALVIAGLAFHVVHCSPFSIFAKRDGLSVLSPQGEDSFSTGIDIDIEWETSSAKKVKIELRKGEPDSLTTVHNIDSDAPNNGTYQWRSNDDKFLEATVGSGLPRNPPSDCDYVIAIRDTETTAHSQYFTIINQNDDGLSEDAECPAANDSPGNGGGTTRGQDEGQDGTSSSGGSNNSTTTPSPATAPAQNQVSRGALGGAVGGTAAALIFIFAAIVFLGRSRGWFVAKDYISQHVAVAIAELRRSDVKHNFETGDAVAPAVQNNYVREVRPGNAVQMPASPSEKY